MRKSGLFAAPVFLGIFVCAHGQVQRTAVPIGDAVGKALAKMSLTGEGAKPFHIRIAVSEPENPQSPYQGSVEEWWVSHDKWHREVTAKNGMHQTIVVLDGKKTEKDEGDYFPLWLRNFVTAVFDPIPNVDAWTGSGIVIEQITMPNGDKSDACARAKSKIGTGDRATDAFSNVCFDGEGLLKFFGSPAYSMEFSDYRGFGKKQIARRFVSDPEPGKNPLPELSDVEIRAQATKIVEPIWPAGSLQPGESVEVEISVNEQGELAGMSFARVPGKFQGPLMTAIRQWTFRPLIRNGKPEYFHGKVKFTGQ